MKTISTNKLAALREAVDAEIHKLFEEKSTVAKVNAAHGGLGKIIGSLNAEMTYAKARGEIPNIPYLTNKVKITAKVTVLDDKFLNTPLKELIKTDNVSVRLRYFINDLSSYFTLLDFIKMSKDDLLKMPNMGRKTLKELDDIIKTFEEEINI